MIIVTTDDAELYFWYKVKAAPLRDLSERRCRILWYITMHYTLF